MPFALAGPWLLHRAVGDSGDLDTVLKECIGFALLFAAATYALRLVINLRRVRGGGPQADPDPYIRPLPTIAIGALGGLLVGITSVGSGSVIMISLVMLYPGLSALRLVGTDLVQAVPLVIAAAISNIALNGLDWHILVPLVIGSTPGSVLGSRIAPRVPQSFIRRGIVIVLTMSGLALLDKAGWAPLGAGEDQTHPVFIALVGARHGRGAADRLGADPTYARACRCTARRPSPSSRAMAPDRPDQARSGVGAGAAEGDQTEVP